MEEVLHCTMLQIGRNPGDCKKVPLGILIVMCKLIFFS